jgi:hypothetical protein
VLPFGRLWYDEQMLSRAIAAAKRSLDIFGAARVKDASSTWRKKSESAH